MTIELIAHDKKRFLPLLLLADEQESMIDRYLERGDLYVMHDDDGTPVAVTVVTLEGEGVCELKNLAVKPEAQRQGIGSRLLGYLCRRYAKSCHVMLVGTGNSPQTTSFYRQNGFTYSHAVPDFFTANYDHPIIENGILLRDMLYFRKPLASPASCILRPAVPEDLPAICALFRDTILTVNLRDYTPEEVADWASCGEDIARWHTLFSTLHFLVAVDSAGNLTGYASLRDDGYLHSLFVHKDHQGEGIASALLSAMEDYARRHGIPEITSEVSLTARPFFERRGYQVMKAQKARARHLYLTNFVMSKSLHP